MILKPPGPALGKGGQVTPISGIISTDAARADRSDKGLKGRRPRPFVEHRGRRSIDGACLQPGCHARLCGGDHRCEVADRHHPGLHPDAPHFVRLQRAQPGRPRLRHDLHVGHEGVLARHRMDGRMGYRRRRHSGHAQPCSGGRAICVPALRRQPVLVLRRTMYGYC